MNIRFIIFLLIFGSVGFSMRGAESDRDIVPVSDGTPQLSIWNYPDYPPEALKHRIEGKVVVRAIIDTEGEVTDARVLTPLDPRLDEVAVETVKGWKFTPGSEFGQPAVCSVDVPVRFSAATAHKKVKLGAMPPSDLRPRRSPRSDVADKSTPDADYPLALAERKIRGIVMFAFVVDEEGRAMAPRVTGATHVEFILPALEALAHWEFIPAKKGDVPLKTPLERKVRFGAQSNSRNEILAANGLTAPDGNAPPHAPEPYIVADPVWPYDLVMAGQGGSAVAEFTVRTDGGVSAVKLREATAPEFGRALVAALETWGFNPATEAGRTVAVSLLLRVEFKAIPVGMESPDDPVQRIVAALRRKEIGSSKDLDNKLTALYRQPPAYPATLAEGDRPAGAARIEFVIDREGRVRLPRIVSATREEFGWAAATAVSQWVFKAPRRGGQPVDVLVQIPFEFGAPKK